MKYILILIIGALIAISCERDDVIDCEVYDITFRDYYNETEYDLVTIEIEDCY